MVFPQIQYLRVRDFDKYLHYRDRQLIWIKSYVSILDEYIMAKIPDAVKWHMHAIVLMAARTDNRIPNDPEYVRSYIKASEPVNLNDFIEWGLLEIVQANSIRDSNFASKFVPNLEQKRSKSASKNGASSGKNLPKSASTEQSRAESESREQKSTEETENTAAANTTVTPARDAAAASIKNEIHQSIYEFDLIVEYVEATKKNIKNPPGLARTLYRSGDEDVKIAAWLAEKEAAAAAEVEAHQNAEQRRIEDAQEYASLLLQSGVNTATDCALLSVAVEYFYGVKDQSAFHLTTYRQLKKLIPSALGILSEDDDTRTHYAVVMETLSKAQGSSSVAS